MVCFLVEGILIKLIWRWLWSLLLFLGHSQAWFHNGWLWHWRRSHKTLFYYFLYFMSYFCWLLLNSLFIWSWFIRTSLWRFDGSQTFHKMSKLALQLLEGARCFRMIKAPSTATKVLSVCLNKLNEVVKLFGWLWSRLTLSCFQNTIVCSFNNIGWQLNVWILIAQVKLKVLINSELFLELIIKSKVSITIKESKENSTY